MGLLRLHRIKRTDPEILLDMEQHYSAPKGFVGRNICYAILYDDTYYGTIVGGSSTRFLAGRDEFLAISPDTKNAVLRHIVNNIFFHLRRPECGKYPIRNMALKVLQSFRTVILSDWHEKYGDDVWAFETLVELPRTGEIYLRDHWAQVGITKGYTCKRTGGKGTDSWSGKRVWNTTVLRPKLVFVRFAE